MKFGPYFLIVWAVLFCECRLPDEVGTRLGMRLPGDRTLTMDEGNGNAWRMNDSADDVEPSFDIWGTWYLRPREVVVLHSPDTLARRVPTLPPLPETQPPRQDPRPEAPVERPQTTPPADPLETPTGWIALLKSLFDFSEGLGWGAIGKAAAILLMVAGCLFGWVQFKRWRARRNGQ